MAAHSDETAAIYRETARRRIVEAKHLLAFEAHKPARMTFDAAVACALLAAECALKAALLYGHSCNSVEEYPDDEVSPCFAGRTGHSLRLLLDRQAPELLRVDAVPTDAVVRLGGCDRYKYRYGVQRPLLLAARPLVDAAEKVVDWMVVVFE
jgi:hypothetical protein